MMKQLASLLLLAPLALAACSSQPKTAPIVATSAINDCALISAISREHFRFTRNDPPRRIKLNGEDLRWAPGCNWTAMGFNLVEGAAAASDTTLAQVEFFRPHYDSQGAEVRVALAPPSGAEVKELCRLKASGESWEVTKCEADPKVNGPRAVGPKPSDMTPERLPNTSPGREPEPPRQDPQKPG